MKRSEMVKIIATAHSRFDCCGHPYDYDDLAEYLLSSIEGAGMAPPFYDKIQDNNGEKVLIPAREWEDE